MNDVNVQDAAEANRYEVTIERQYIVYAPNAEAAGVKVLDHLGFRKKPGQEIEVPAKVIEVKELPALLDEKHPPIIDVAPGREARK